MSSYEMSPHLISKIEEIINNDIRVMGLLAEIVDDIGDPTLRAIITSIIGDENGHVRLFRSLLSQMTYGSPCSCCHRYDNSRRTTNCKKHLPYLKQNIIKERRCFYE